MTGRKLLWFLIKAFLVLILFALIWPLIDPTYHGLVVRATDALFPGLRDVGLPLGEYASYFNLGLLLALLLATPQLGWIHRFSLTVAGVIVMFALHVLTRALTLSSFLGLVGSYNGQSYGYSWLWLYAFAAIEQVIAPFAIWILLTLRIWLPRPAAENAGE